jgi:hypothetical protein
MSGTKTFDSLQEVLSKYELVDAQNDVIIVSERPGDMQLSAGDVDLSELGTANPSPFNSWLRRDYNADMMGHQGLRNFDKMRRSDGTIRSTLRLVKTPVLAARWYMEPASESTRDKNAADFVWKNLTEWMTMDWQQFLMETLLCLDYGYYMFEKVFDYGEAVTDDPIARGKIVWRKLAPRHPMDALSWYYDANGGPNGVRMYDPDNNDYIDIPIEKLVVFTYDKEAGNMEGMSLLRSAWRNWFYKDQLYKIDSIQKERHGMGVPIIILPMGYTNTDKKLADELGRNVRTNERAHIVLPPLWQFAFAELKGQPVDALASAEHHDAMMEKNVLASFMGAKTNTKPEDQMLFLKATRFVADEIVTCINRYAIPQLVDYNWLRVGRPKLTVRRIGEHADWRTLSFAIRNFIGAGVIRPDDRLEENIREEMDLPKADPATIREVATPQNPAGAPGKPAAPQAGPPKQSTAGKQKIGPSSGAAGRDTSGGK